MDTQLQPLSRREAAKTERRDRIVSAATELIREVGFSEISMTEIAERAQVAPATLYNLFNTKRAIFQRVLQLDLESYQALVSEQRAETALDRLFVAIDVAASLYAQEPDFYRAMARESGLAHATGPEPYQARRSFWATLVSEASVRGELVEEADTQLLGRALTRLMRGTFLEWADDLISAERLAKEVAFGFAALLLPYAAESGRAALSSRLTALSADIAALPT